MEDFTESDWYYVNESEATNGFEVNLETSSDKHPADKIRIKGKKSPPFVRFPAIMSGI